jgi:hypothetical protein
MNRTWLLIPTIVVLGTAGAALAQAALQPHVAAYRLGLDSRGGASALIEVRGGLVIEWQQNCDGWLSRQRLGFVGRLEGGGTISHDVRFSSWESTDGSNLRFAVRSFENDHLQKEFRGVAEIKEDSGGIAEFTTPHEQTVILPPGTIFPTEHIQLVLQAAEAGSRFVSHEVFDGYDFDALTQVTSVIGAPQALQPGSGIEAPDGSDSAWPLSMAYYNVARDEEEPDFETTFLIDDKGILYDVGLDYGDFRLEAELEQLELLDHPDC